MYSKEQMEAKEAECRKWREAAEVFREDLRDRFAIHCPITFTDFSKAHYEDYKDETPETVMAQYCLMRYRYADTMLKMRDISRTCGKSD